MEFKQFVKRENPHMETKWLKVFYKTFAQNKLMYVTDEFIRWLGYNAFESHHRRSNFMNMFRKADHSEIGFSYREYKALRKKRSGSELPRLHRRNTAFRYLVVNSHQLKQILRNCRARPTHGLYCSAVETMIQKFEARQAIREIICIGSD